MKFLDDYKNFLESNGLPEYMAQSVVDELVVDYITQCLNDETWLERVEERMQSNSRIKHAS